MRTLALEKSPKACRIVAALAFISSLGFFAGAGWACHSSVQKREKWQQAEAQVVQLVKRSSSAGSRRGTSITYSPRFVFTANDGQRYDVTSPNSSDPPGYDVGERLTVLYPAENPAAAVEHSFMGLWCLPTLLAVIGGADALLGGFLLRLARRRQRALTEAK